MKIVGKKICIRIMKLILIKIFDSLENSYWKSIMNQISIDKEFWFKN